MATDSNPFDGALDSDLAEAMDFAYELISSNPSNKDSADQLRMRIVAHNLRALATVILMGDDNPEIQVNLKQVVLGLLGTSDWLFAHLPELEDEEESNGV